MLTFGSLFAGIGGFDLGFERAGMRCLWQVEIDDYCRRVLAKHWPDVKRYEDVRECGAHNLEPVDLIGGGFPCQDLSVAGKRGGIRAERSGLFFEFVRLARELRPAWLVLENVPGLLSSNDGRDMGIVIGTLEDAGYMGAWRVLDSQWFGVAQRRRRLFIVCHSDARRAGAVLFEPEGGAGHPTTVRKAGTDIAHALDARSGGVSAKENQETLVSFIDAYACRGSSSPNQAPCKLSGLSDALDTTGPGAVAYAIPSVRRGIGNAWNTNYVSHALNAHGGSHGRIDGESETFIAHALSHEGYDGSEDGTGRGTPIVCDANRHEASEPRSQDDKQQDGRRSTGDGRGQSGRPEPDNSGIAPSSSGDREAVTCPSSDAHRVREVAGLPRRLDARRYKALGNAVTVPVLEWLGRRIVEANS